MKVLFISHEASRTGAPLALFQMLCFFKEHYKDIKFELLLLRGGDLLSEFENICLVHKGWNDYSFKYWLLYKFNRNRAVRPYLYIFKKREFDCIYANTVASFKVATILKKQLNIPVIGHVHEAECLMRIYNLPIVTFQEIDSFITVSELAAYNLMNNYSVPRNKILIQNPISVWVERFIKEETKFDYLSFHDGSFIVGLFNNGGWFKSTELIPVIISNFFKKYPKVSCTFVVCGDIDNQILFRLKYDLRKLDLLDKIIFIGGCEQPLKLIYNFDIFLLASREESFSLAAQEAGCLGKPIVAFEGATGMAEWIKDEAGILVPYMDFDRLSEAIFLLYKNKELRDSLGYKARYVINRIYETNYEMNNIVFSIKKYGN